MTKSFTSKVAAALAFAAMSSAMLLAPLQASAGGTTSLGHGVKCFYVLVASDPATGSETFQLVCGRGA